MKRYLIYIICITMLGVTSCSKQNAVMNSGANGEVQFFFNGIIGEDAVSYEAGNNNFFLNTYYEDNGATDVLKMYGTFQSKDSVSNSDYLQFQFYGYDSVNNDFVLDNVFNQTDIFSYSQDSSTVTSGNLELKFDAINLFGSTHTWDFGDGSPTVVGATTNHTYTINTPVNVNLTSNYTVLGNCTDSITNTIDLGNLNTCQVQFDVTTQGALDSFTYVATQGFQNYDWRVNGVSQQMNMSTISQFYNDSINREVVLIATDGSCQSSWRAKITPNFAGCFAGFKYTVLQQPVTTITLRPEINTCIINYRKNGVLYSSFKQDGSNQSNKVVFRVNGAAPYDNNPAGDKTIRINGTVDTYLYNVNNAADSISIQSNNVSIAVAHP